MARMLTATEAGTLDKVAGERYGVSIGTLMENAGQALAEHAEACATTRRAVVFAGPGNNGGDGFVAARLLRERGLHVEVTAVAPTARMTGIARDNLQRWQVLGTVLEDGTFPELQAGDVAVDAIFGTGLKRAPEGRPAAAIAWINDRRARGCTVIAADLPSGLDSDTGLTPGACVQADLSVTFAALKRGLCQEPGASLAGRIVVADIGIPQEAYASLPGPSTELLEEGQMRALFTPRPAASFKNDYGHLLVVAGSWDKSGAAALVVRGALRAGAGLVTLQSRPAAIARVVMGTPEVMSLALPGAHHGPLGLSDLPHLLEGLQQKTALAAGPGIPRGPETAALLGGVLKEFPGPVVLDADALNAVAEQPEILHSIAGRGVITPHPGEMARLTKTSSAQVQSDRFGTAQRFAREYGVTVLLKGAKTVIGDPDGALWVVPTGNPGLAKGGTGDVLCGIVGGLLAQRLSPSAAARAGAYLHGLAADRLTSRRGQRGILASDLPEELGSIWADWHL
jgi:NAD(P)H-hydrate epimerase